MDGILHKWPKLFIANIVFGMVIDTWFPQTNPWMIEVTHSCMCSCILHPHINRKWPHRHLPLVAELHKCQMCWICNALHFSKCIVMSFTWGIQIGRHLLGDGWSREGGREVGRTGQQASQIKNPCQSTDDTVWQEQLVYKLEMNTLTPERWGWELRSNV